MKGLLRYILRRLLWTLPTLFLVSLMVFFLVRFVPGDPAQLILGDLATEEELAHLHEQLGLDRSIPEQYLIWGRDVLRGDLGESITNGLPVAELVLKRFRVSATIVLPAVLLAVLIAVPLGLLAAWKQNKTTDVLVVTFATLLMSVPSFWLGLMLLLVFGLGLGWLPIVGFVPISTDPIAGLQYIILPMAAIALIEMGVLTRMMRASAVEVLRLEYVTHARAKGLSETRVLLRHVLPNAFAPTWTMIGLVLGSMLGGIAVLETVFTLPGLGRLLVDSIFQRDYPVIQGCLLFIALVYVVVNLVVDLCYPLFDPRVSVQ